MGLGQYLRIVWARKWLVLALLVVIGIAGSVITMYLPKQYTAETSLVVEMRIDPALGALAPALAAPNYMATQIEIIRSERVASRAVKILGVERSAAAVAQWREATNAKIPLERYFAGVLSRGLGAEPLRGSNVINLSFSGSDPTFVQAAANAFAQAYMDVSVELRVAPARQSATFLDEQGKAMRANLEQAQGGPGCRSSSKPRASSSATNVSTRKTPAICRSSRNSPTRRPSASRLRRGSATPAASTSSPDVLSSGAIQGLKAQIAAAETRLTEISGIVGKNHPTRIQLEAQIGELKSQLAAETRRVAGGTSLTSRGSTQKVAGVAGRWSMRRRSNCCRCAPIRDQIAVYQRDVDAAQPRLRAPSRSVWGKSAWKGRTTRRTRGC